MGVVYQAEHRLMERTVALKVVNPRLVSDASAVERFHQEVKAAARLAHRNIVTAYDAEQAGDVHFLVMEYVEGASLAAIISRRGQLPVLHACNYAMQAAAGLQHAHEHGMVHRDIKPQNLMRTPKGTIKILDFGLARFASQQDDDAAPSGLTSAGTAVGTADYMSPEQARNSSKADIRADIYSLGCTLYHLLAGRVPFPHGTPIEKVVSHFEHQPTPLAELRDDVPAEVVGIVERMMAKDPQQRFQTPAEVVEALRPFGLPGAGTETSPIDVSAATKGTASDPATADSGSNAGGEDQEHAASSSLTGALALEVEHARAVFAACCAVSARCAIETRRRLATRAARSSRAGRRRCGVRPADGAGGVFQSAQPDGRRRFARLRSWRISSMARSARRQAATGST